MTMRDIRAINAAVNKKGVARKTQQAVTAKPEFDMHPVSVAARTKEQIQWTERWRANQAAEVAKHVRQRVLERLDRIKQDVERALEDYEMLDRPSVSDAGRLISNTQHVVLWGLANMDLNSQITELVELVSGDALVRKETERYERAQAAADLETANHGASDA